MEIIIDITNTANRLNLQVSGADPKLWVSLLGSNWLLKRGKENNELAPFSEHVGSTFIRLMGMSCQETMLVTFEGKLWVACKDIGRIRHFSNIQESSLDTDPHGKYYTFDNVIHEISCMSKLSEQAKDSILYNFVYVFLCDAIIANRDRHAGNWGYSKDGMVPIFDNGASLFPGLFHFEDMPLKRMFRRLVIEEPTSSVQRRLETGKLRKHSFHFMLNNTSGMESVLAKLQSNDVYSIISSAIEDIPEPLKGFYYKLLILRYECIIRRGDFNEYYDRIESASLKPYTCLYDLLRECRCVQINGTTISI